MSEPEPNKRHNNIWPEGINNYAGYQNVPSNNANLYMGQEQFVTSSHQQAVSAQQPIPSGPHPSGENYTVLSVGHGNYLKVYHNNDDTTKYNNYELFSNNSFIPHNVVLPQQQAPSQDNFLYARTNINQDQQQRNQQRDEQVAHTTNMLINQLVGNWVPNVSGTYSPFGETLDASLNESPIKNIQSTSASNSSHMSSQIHFPQNAPLIETNNLAKQHVNSGSNKCFQSQETIPKLSETIKKPRIVAEVKPMRMTYSDVLSKNVAIKKDIPNATNNNPSPNNGSNNASNKSFKILSDKNKQPNGNFSDKKSSNINDENSMKSKKVHNGNSAKIEDQFPNNANVGKDTKGSGASDDGGIGKENKTQSTDNNKAANKKKQVKTGSNKTSKSTSNQNDLKKRQSQQSHLENDLDEDDSETMNEEIGYFYNVTKTNNSDSYAAEKSAKPLQHLNKNRNRTSTAQRTAATSRKNESNNALYMKRGGQRVKKNDKYAFFVKLIEKWLEYMLKIITWLISLVSDVVFLSFGIFWDKVCSCCQLTCQCYQSIRSELKCNSNLPLAWIKKSYKYVTGKFSQNSKWAFWRKWLNRKKPEEPTTDFYKNGRLPQTGDEAMYSLLNCKGKDAYSILGVSSECTQEQIRKHYKKIAVLVHPDKNKQPGAEEAFKVLQRAFELIGEPENRKAYDQSLAEALNAEKAWSELNDLLTQLHTKIAEAANTIRCSSCGLRHPRKPTGRPCYAARECDSCKIRHSAREGDIWAETSFLGLRWKYLALMEGTVYDITEWANCQKGALSHLKPKSHAVQYRIVLGGQQQQSNPDKEKFKKEPSANQPNLDDFLTNLYGGPNQQSQNNSRRRTKRN